MSLGLQAKFLRVLEQKEVTRVGALKPRPIDVRIVAATNRDLQAEIDVGRFRRDLYFRLNGVSLVVPPLRERVDEIRAARAQVRRQGGRASQCPTPSISPEVLALFRAYGWPGNVRELRNVAERAVLLCAGDVIQLQHLPVDKMAPELPSRAGAGASVAHRASTLLAGRGEGAPPPPVIQAIGEDGIVRNGDEERARIVEALRVCHGNQTRAAELLGMSRRTLVSRLTEYDLPRPRKATSASPQGSEKGRSS